MVKMKYPNVYNVYSVEKTMHSTTTEINGKWVACRPLGFPSFISRVKCAWLVFTGRADALIWPEGQ